MRGYARSMLIALSVVQIVALAHAEDRKAVAETARAASSTAGLGRRTIKDVRPNSGTPLDRVAYAVDGAESSHGADPTMWRPDDPIGPQGPMQVSGAAAADVGGGNRFDSIENREIGRAYLAQLYRRYKNWPDAIAAYNWGMGNVDAWIKAGRPADKFVVAAYLHRVLHDSGICDGATEPLVGSAAERPRPRKTQAETAAGEDGDPKTDALALAACGDPDAWGGALDGQVRPLSTPSRFFAKLEKAIRLTAQHLPVSQHSSSRASHSWHIAMQR